MLYDRAKVDTPVSGLLLPVLQHLHSVDGLEHFFRSKTVDQEKLAVQADRSTLKQTGNETSPMPGF